MQEIAVISQRYDYDKDAILCLYTCGQYIVKILAIFFIALLMCWGKPELTGVIQSQTNTHNKQTEFSCSTTVVV